MKKVLLATIALVVIGMTSCQKEEGATPEITKETGKIADRKDVGSWD